MLKSYVLVYPESEGWKKAEVGYDEYKEGANADRWLIVEVHESERQDDASQDKYQPKSVNHAVIDTHIDAICKRSCLRVLN